MVETDEQHEEVLAGPSDPTEGFTDDLLDRIDPRLRALWWTAGRLGNTPSARTAPTQVNGPEDPVARLATHLATCIHSPNHSVNNSAVPVVHRRPGSVVSDAPVAANADNASVRLSLSQIMSS